MVNSLSLLSLRGCGTSFSVGHLAYSTFHSVLHPTPATSQPATSRVAARGVSCFTAHLTLSSSPPLKLSVLSRLSFVLSTTLPTRLPPIGIPLSYDIQCTPPPPYSLHYIVQYNSRILSRQASRQASNLRPPPTDSLTFPPPKQQAPPCSRSGNQANPLSRQSPNSQPASGPATQSAARNSAKSTHTTT
ncbi:hypothetical protein F5Y09DRAFT_39615 [Xylaria sp. FL1042]|nr:hypothetical protein F5Y09DRAFT_39615 [Xylaria sp. FL1042]